MRTQIRLKIFQQKTKADDCDGALSANKTNSSNLYPPIRGYIRETCKSQHINPISPTLKFTLGIIHLLTMV